MFVVLLVASIALPLVTSQGIKLSSMEGDQIVMMMQSTKDICHPPPDKQEWAPMPSGASCGDVPRCDFPKQWCAYKAGHDGAPDPKSMKCQPLNDECKKTFETLEKWSSLTPEGQPPPPPPPPQSTPPPPPPPPPQSTPPPPPPPPSTPPATPPPPPPPPPPPQSTHPPPPPPPSTPPATPPGPPPPPPPPPPPKPKSKSPRKGSKGDSKSLKGGSSPPGSPPAAAPSLAVDGGNKDESLSVIPAFGECCDYHEFCCFWASVGQCDTNKLFMVQLCQSSCGTCGCSKKSLNECKIKVAEACMSGNVTATSSCQCKPDHLINRDWHRECGTWAQQGFCESKAEFMRPMCKKSCNVCKA